MSPLQGITGLNIKDNYITRNDNKESRPIVKNNLALKVVTPMNPTPRKQSRNSVDHTVNVKLKNMLHTEVKKVT